MAKAKRNVCKKCSRVIPPNARICMYCDTPVDTPKKKKPIGLIVTIIIWTIVIAALGIIGYIVYDHFAYLKIDAEDIVKVNIEGANKEATAYLSINSDSDYILSNETGLNADNEEIPKLLEVYTNTKDIEKSKAMQNSLKANIYFADDDNDTSFSKKIGSDTVKASSIDKISGITNGDTLTVTIRFDESALKKNNIKIINTTFTVFVDDLGTVSGLNPFNDVSVRYSGTNGHGSAAVMTNNASAIIIDNFNYDISSETSENGELSNDDEITVTATCTSSNYNPDTKTLTYEGNSYFISKTTTKKYTVEDLGAISSIDPFENVSIIYKGASPRLSIDGVNTEKAIDVVGEFFDFSFSKSSSLKAGDTITATVSYKDGYTKEKLEELGYKIKIKKRTYTVSDVNKYITKTNGYNLSGIRSTLHKELSAFKNGKVSLYAAFFNTATSKNTSKAYNQYFEIYKIVIDSQTIYRLVGVDNIYVTPKKSLKYTLIDNTINGNVSSLVKENIRSDSTHYKTTKLTLKSEDKKVTL